MSRRRSLEHAPITPCPRTWSSLEPVDPTGAADRIRYCDDCRLHVHNLAAYTRREARRLVEGREGRLCVLRVLDGRGRMVSRESAPAPLARLRAGLARTATWLLLLAGGALASCSRGEERAPASALVPTPEPAEPDGPEAPAGGEQALVPPPVPAGVETDVPAEEGSECREVLERPGLTPEERLLLGKLGYVGD